MSVGLVTINHPFETCLSVSTKLLSFIIPYFNQHIMRLNLGPDPHAPHMGHEGSTKMRKDSVLGKGSKNQNGNLRWFLPWRGGRGSRVPHTYSEKRFYWKPFRIIPWLLKRVLHLVWALYYVYIVVEMTLNMAKLLGPSVTSISNHLEFPFWFIRGLKSDIFDWDQV